MKKVNLLKMITFMVLAMSFVFITSCEEDSTDASIVGVWTASGTTLVMTVNGQSYLAYAESVLGMTTTEAQAAFNAIVSERQMTGTLEFKANGTFNYSWRDGADTGSGTYTLVGDVLTLLLNIDDTMIFDVTTLTGSKLKIKNIETEHYDLSGDQVDETVVSTVEMSFTR